MNIIVTGASGFVGGHIARDLANAGHKVFGLNRRTFPKHKNIKWIKTDLSKNFPIVPGLIDVVIHSAALADYHAPYDQLYQANVVATKQIYSLAIEKKAKIFIYISSGSVYKELCEKKLIDESFPLVTKNGNSYAKTKKQAENFLRAQKKLPTIILRPHLIYGPGDTTVLKQFLERVKVNRAFVPISKTSLISATYVGNLASAVEYFVKNKHIAHEHDIYNIADPSPIQMWKFVKLMIERIDQNISLRSLPPIIGTIGATFAESWATLTKTPPLITKDLTYQLSHDFTYSQKKILATGFAHPFTFSSGLTKTTEWFDQYPNKDAYLKQVKKVWPGIPTI